MRAESTLFSKGYLTGQPSLADVLDAHKRRVINKIRSISDLEQMTDSFLERLVKESLVETVVLHFDRISRKLRTEEFDGSVFPADFNVERGRRYPKQVARISIPFSGDPMLLDYTPEQGVFNFPQGEIYDHTIQFDVILWGHHDDASRVKEQVESNRSLLEMYATNVSKQVREFNEALPARVKAAFTAKLDELTKQHAVFDDLGIPEEPEPPALPSGPGHVQPKKGKARAVQIIQIIDKMYVEQLNQTNNNRGDVNNAIQSN
jgi:hypothetical protein